MDDQPLGSTTFWEALAQLVDDHEIVLDRPKGSRHPTYPEVVYPLDYGYLSGTTTVDGGGIDIFVGSRSDNLIQGILTTVDLKKNDAEIKILYNCTEAEAQEALRFFDSRWMRALLVPHPHR